MRKLLIFLIFAIFVLDVRAEMNLEIPRDTYTNGETVQVILNLEYPPIYDLKVNDFSLEDRYERNVPIGLFLNKFNSTSYNAYFDVNYLNNNWDYVLKVDNYYYIHKEIVFKLSNITTIKIRESTPIISVFPGSQVLDLNKNNYFYLSLKNNLGNTVLVNLYSKGTLSENSFYLTNNKNVKVTYNGSVSYDNIFVSYPGKNYTIPVKIIPKLQSTQPIIYQIVVYRLENNSCNNYTIPETTKVNSDYFNLTECQAYIIPIQQTLVQEAIPTQNQTQVIQIINQTQTVVVTRNYTQVYFNRTLNQTVKINKTINVTINKTVVKPIVASVAIPNDAIKFVERIGSANLTLDKNQTIDNGFLRFKNFFSQPIYNVTFKLTGNLNEVIRISNTFVEVINPNETLKQYLWVNEGKSLNKDYSGELVFSSKNVEGKFPIYIHLKNETNESEKITTELLPNETVSGIVITPKEEKSNLIIYILIVLILIILIAIVSHVYKKENKHVKGELDDILKDVNLK